MQDDKYYCEIRTKNIHKYTNSNGEIEIDEGKNYVFEVKIQAVDFEYSRAKDDLEELDDKDENYMNKYKRIIDDSIIIKCLLKGSLYNLRLIANDRTCFLFPKGSFDAMVTFDWFWTDWWYRNTCNKIRVIKQLQPYI